MRDRSVRDGVPRLAAYGVHLLTASGAVCGLLALQAIAGGRFKNALVWMAVAVVIDGVDGPLARSVGVSRVLPGIDGTLLDNVVDYLNYVVVPAFLIVEASLVPLRLEVVGGAAICLSSAFQFTRIDAKTPDHFFRGFPSYWNVLAFYLLVLRLDPRLNLAIIVVLAVLVFVPVRYVHPTRTRALRGLTLSLTLAWGACLLVLLASYPDAPRVLAYGSLLYGLYYVAVSLALARRSP